MTCIFAPEFDPDPGYWWPKTVKEIYKNWNLPYLSLGLQDVKATEEALKREHLALQNMKFLNFFYFCRSFLPTWIRIRISNPDPDTDPLTWLNPDPKHRFTNCVWRLVYSERSRRGSTARTWNRAARRPRMKTSPVRKRTLSVRSFIKSLRRKFRTRYGSILKGGIEFSLTICASPLKLGSSEEVGILSSSSFLPYSTPHPTPSPLPADSRHTFGVVNMHRLVELFPSILLKLFCDFTQDTKKRTVVIW